MIQQIGSQRDSLMINNIFVNLNHKGYSVTVDARVLLWSIDKDNY